MKEKNEKWSKALILPGRWWLNLEDPNQFPTTLHYTFDATDKFNIISNLAKEPQLSVTPIPKECRKYIRQAFQAWQNEVQQYFKFKEIDAIIYKGSAVDSICNTITIFQYDKSDTTEDDMYLGAFSNVAVSKTIAACAILGISSTMIEGLKNPKTRNIALKQLINIVTHELGHILGLKHPSPYERNDIAPFLDKKYFSQDCNDSVMIYSHKDCKKVAACLDAEKPKTQKEILFSDCYKDIPQKPQLQDGIAIKSKYSAVPKHLFNTFLATFGRPLTSRNDENIQLYAFPTPTEQGNPPCIDQTERQESTRTSSASHTHEVPFVLGIIVTGTQLIKNAVGGVYNMLSSCWKHAFTKTSKEPEHTTTTHTTVIFPEGKENSLEPVPANEICTVKVEMRHDRDNVPMVGKNGNIHHVKGGEVTISPYCTEKQIEQALQTTKEQLPHYVDGPTTGGAFISGATTGFTNTALPLLVQDVTKHLGYSDWTSYLATKGVQLALMLQSTSSLVPVTASKIVENLLYYAGVSEERSMQIGSITSVVLSAAQNYTNPGLFAVSVIGNTIGSEVGRCIEKSFVNYLSSKEIETGDIMEL